MSQIWTDRIKSQFKKDYKNLDPQLQKRVKQAMDDLLSSEKPEQLGIFKKGLNVFAYEIGRKYRIVYYPRHDYMAIEFYRVCDHKSAYMKD